MAAKVRQPRPTSQRLAILTQPPQFLLDTIRVKFSPSWPWIVEPFEHFHTPINQGVHVHVASLASLLRRIAKRQLGLLYLPLHLIGTLGERLPQRIALQLSLQQAGRLVLDVINPSDFAVPLLEPCQVAMQVTAVVADDQPGKTRATDGRFCSRES